MRFGDLIEQLGRRRVIRAAVIYGAFVWVTLQVADVLAGEGIVPAHWVRWFIVAAATGLPFVLLGSWFLESPWRKRGRMAAAGDLFVIAAIAAGASLFAWQQWFAASGRIAIAVGSIEATDLREDTQFLANHLADRFAQLLDAEPGAALRLDGTLSRGGDALRLTMRLVGETGAVAWSQTFEEAVVDQAQLQAGVVDALAAAVPFTAARRSAALALIDACAYPSSAAAVIAIADETEPELLAPLVQENADNGLLLLAQAVGWFRARDAAPPPKKPVLHALAMQSLDDAARACPGYAPIDAVRVAYTQSANP